MKNKRLFTTIISLVFLFTLIFPVTALMEETGCGVYFTGIGCPHCAKADPILLEDTVPYQEVLVIEYEIYQKDVNAGLLYDYNTNYGTRLGVPQLISNQNTYYTGDKQINDVCDECSDVVSLADNLCVLQNKTISLSELDFNSLPGKPVIWYDNKVLIRTNISNSYDSNILKQLLVADLNKLQIKNITSEENLTFLTPQPVPLSGSKVEFDNAVELNGWILQWKNSDEIINNTQESNNTINNNQEDSMVRNIGLWKVISLAAVDAINPCALAVLSMMLIAIVTYNPKNKKKLLLSGLAFAASVFIMYLFYGLVIIKFFQLVQAITSIRLVLYKILGAVAIILGILEIKDFISYKAGSFGTEMPLSLRPKVKKLISKVTSPKGAFVVGLFVTLFLLPCTIGPYVIMGGILSAFEILKTMPLLLLYNFIFVLPMIIITFVVYNGVKRVEDVSAWKDKNIKLLHLVAGIIIFLLGLGMLLGLV